MGQMFCYTDDKGGETMAYTELIKSFERIRDYMREFYVYGFKSREEYDKKSARTYDDERRRMESWLGDYMGFRRDASGKNVFLSIDSRSTRHNPLFAAWKACGFTDGDITLHFLLFDILADTETALSLGEITEAMDARLAGFAEPKTFDESTVRKKLKEYVAEGFFTTEKCGKTVCYRRAADTPLPDADLLHFFSEVAPCGVVGSFLLDRAEHAEDHLAFKHHYITQTPDSGILCSLFDAMREHRAVTIRNLGKRDSEPMQFTVVPLRIFISAQNGRQYLLCFRKDGSRFSSFRLDYILGVEAGEVREDFDVLRARLDALQQQMWGVSTHGEEMPLETVSFTVWFTNFEDHIYRRLLREKRCGRVELLDANTARFTAEVCDVGEMIPWIRTFICRITEFSCSNALRKARFLKDLDAMYELYGLKGGDTDALS